MATPTPDRETIRAQACALGFDAVGFARAETALSDRENLTAFLAQGLDGEMAWLRTNADRRADPKVLWPEARSVVMVAMNYAPEHPPAAAAGEKADGVISIYARNRDYHDVFKKKLRQLARWLAQNAGGDVKLFVDTAPVMEKPLAQASGLGWQGKHTNLVSREFGSWLFLGEVFTTLEIEPDAPEEDHCGACRRCLDVCPTSAFIGPYQIDARRCVSYLTIEHKGHIDRSLRASMGNRIYGCDDCLAVCPWNKYARMTEEPGFLQRAALTAPKLAELAVLDDRAFRALFAGSPIKRIGRDRFVRNVMIAIGNSGEGSIAAAARAGLSDASALVRAAAVWAVRRLVPPPAAAALRAAHCAGESDAAVREEWTAEA